MVSFLKKLFGRDAGQCLRKGEDLLRQGRLAEARDFFSEGLQQREGMTDEVKQLLQENLKVAADGLAAMNIREAESLITFDLERATDHLRLAVTLADDANLREKAEKLLHAIPEKAPEPHRHAKGHSCGGCGGSTGEKAEISQELHDYLNEDEQFELLVAALPGDLPERYRGLGKEFANAYMAAHAGNAAHALEMLGKVSSTENADILCYERAVLYHRVGDAGRTEKLLRQAMQGDRYNPLAVVTFAELMVETGRPAQAVPVLEDMWVREVLRDQAALLLGDVYQVMRETDKALEWYGRLLKGPAAKDAARRMVPLLMSCQRAPEAEFLTKTYLKCC